MLFRSPSSSSSTASAGSLVIVGGEVSHRANEKMYCVNALNEVEELSEIPFDLERGHSVCACSGGFILTGGMNGSVLCARFESRGRLWSRLSDLRKTKFKSCMKYWFCTDF